MRVAAVAGVAAVGVMLRGVVVVAVVVVGMILRVAADGEVWRWLGSLQGALVGVMMRAVVGYRTGYPRSQ